MNDPANLAGDEPASLFPDSASRRQSEQFYRAARTNVTSKMLDGAMAAIDHALQTPVSATPEPPLTDAVLVARNKVHGDFAVDAALSQEIKNSMRRGLNWSNLSLIQKEALEHIATKIARILSGDPSHADHWKDIQGYARLVEKSLW
jgi:hypothetical protein